MIKGQNLPDYEICGLHIDVSIKIFRSLKLNTLIINQSVLSKIKHNQTLRSVTHINLREKSILFKHGGRKNLTLQL